MRLDRDDVERLDPEVAAELPERGERCEVGVDAVEAADAGATAVVEVEVRGKQRAQALEVVGVPGADDVERHGRRTVGAARGVALEELRARGGAVVGVER